MHTFWIRANAVFFFGLGVLAVLAGLNVLSTWIDPPGIPIVKKFRVHDLRRLHKFRGSDRAILTVDLDVDLNPVMTWNVKQLYAFVVVEYNGPSKKQNKIVIYDSILQRDKSDFRLRGDDLIKYPIEDQKDDLRDVSISIKFAYDVHPLFGPLQLFGTGRYEILYDENNLGQVNYTFPTVYN